jgi:hypothetical protein
MFRGFDSKAAHPVFSPSDESRANAYLAAATNILDNLFYLSLLALIFSAFFLPIFLAS